MNEPSPTMVRVSVVNGNLRFVRQPLLLGHYRAMAFTGTERVMDDLIGGAMHASLAMGQYPKSPGAHQVFVNTVNRANPLQSPRPEAVIVVGLGEEGTLRGADLTRTVRQGVIAWSQRMFEGLRPAPSSFELAATLIGSGGTGISAGQSACLVAQGVLDANQRLADTGWPTVRQLYLIELYLDRATEAWHALRVQVTATPEKFAVADVIHPGAGALRRPLDESYRDAGYDLITAMTVDRGAGNDGVLYTLDTKRARTEVRAQATQRPLVRELVAVASNDKNSDPQIGRTLFQLLVPLEMEAYLAGTTAALLELDAGTAGIPWEMLDTTSGADGDGDSLPWAIRARLLRRLRTADFRSQVVDAEGDASVLVIGEPACDSARYRRLPSAQAEAREVADLLEAHPALGPSKVRALISPDPAQMGAGFRTIINALLERNWRIIHITGHGEPPEECAGVPADPRGVVLSDGIFLGAREIRSMRVVPDLVFMNCCHLAARDANELLREEDLARTGAYDRARFAANVAEALIGIGVRCVIAAGWAVEDEAARVFATSFYDRLIGGHRFVDAVAWAREAARKKGGNTWAAYQCYGDPDWTFRRHEADTAADPPPPEEVFANVASPASLRLALETMAVNSRFYPIARAGLHGNLDFLEERYAKRWGGMGAVAEAFGMAWAERDRARAAEWYQRALAANDGGASLRAAEQLGNLRARLAWDAVAAATQPSEGTAGEKQPETLEAARREITDALDLLQRITGIQPSIERESLCGSAWKRKALLEALAGRPQAEAEAIASMKEHYARAEALARANEDPELFYPALNRMAAELIVDAAEPEWPGFDSNAIAEVEASLRAKVEEDPDFWSVVGLTELRLYVAIAAESLAATRASIEQEYEDLHKRISADWQWASVRDQVRFVLPKYAARASAAERAASTALMSLLEGFARSSG